jgi:hypothetical protein
VPKKTIPDQVKNVVGSSGALAFFAITGFLGVIAFTYYVCYHRKKNPNRDDLYSFKELEDEADVFGGEYEGDEIIFTDEDGTEDVLLQSMGSSRV